MPAPETKTCQNCKTKFSIESEDFDFYEKIKVPPPTWCPRCRLLRKMARRNERSLYKGKCASCKKEVIFLYPENAPFTVYCNDCWWSDEWDSLEYGKKYDFNKSFFEQFYILSLKVPRLALYQKGNVNSPYTNHADHNKNCYLAFNNGFCEDSMYCKWGIRSKDLVDCYSIFNSELVYESQDSERCSRCKYVYYSHDCVDSNFLFNCKGCQNCSLCSNLRNSSYCFGNRQYSKEEYYKLLLEMEIDSYKGLQKLSQQFNGEVLPKTLRKYAIANKVVNATGDYFNECKNTKECFHVMQMEDCAFCVDDGNMKDSYDAYESAFNCERQYECHAGNRLSNSNFCTISYDSHHLEYCEMCHDSSYLFACIGLRNKQYCILNKQYTKEEYEELVPKIIQHMNDMPYTDKKGRVYRYGEFFPPELSPFCYNETIAQEYFPLTKEQAQEQGYSWKDPEPRDYQITMKTVDIPDNIKDVNDSILNEVIECAHATCLPAGRGDCNEQCTTAFRIIPQELQFYRKMNLPLPRLCPNCR
ncbi:MAG: hypothetical protein PHN39_02725, partial [Candidatus Pacebacteria bacterium]|nr:hypothetical protein [Candidatus Paceibacterota bacterium]